MVPPRRLVRVGIGSALALLVLAACVLFALAGGGHFRRPLEAAATRTLGMNVRIMGRLGLGLIPAPGVTAWDCRVLGDSGAVVMSVKRARFRFAFLPLLTGHLRLERVDLSTPQLVVIRDRARHVNVARLRGAVSAPGALDGARVTISDGTVDYSDLASGATYRVSGIALDTDALVMPGGPAGSSGPQPGVRARFACREFTSRRFTLSNLKTTITAGHGTIECSHLTAELLGGKWSGTVRADLSGDVPGVRLAGTLPSFRIERVPVFGTAKERLVGTMSLDLDLAMRGRTSDELIRSLGGSVKLRGRDLVLEGNDIDRTFARYEASQHFNLVDVGAVVFATPVVLALSRGYGVAGLLEGTGGRSPVTMLVSDWTVSGGTARAQDVALATARNRIAIGGGLDLVHERFLDLTVAVVDEHGCARLRQEVHGDFDHPDVQKPEVLGSLTGPVVGLLKRVRKLLPDKPCKPFYTGSVPPPR